MNKFFWRSLPGWIAMLIVTLLLFLGVFQPLEWIIYNNLFQMRGAINWDERIVLVAIDDKSLNEFGQFPWSRQRYIELLNVLDQAQPNVVAFDIIFSDQSPDDVMLAKAIEQHGKVVLAQAWDTEGKPWQPRPELKQAAITTGHILRYKDGDGMLRKVETEIKGVPSLGIASLTAYNTFAETPPLKNIERPLWINWISKADDIPHYSFVDVVRQKIPREKFENKIVLVGVTAPGIDGLTTPFDYDPPTGGVCVHTTIISNFLKGNFLHLLPPGGWVMLLMLGGPGLAWATAYWRTREKLGFFAVFSIIWVFLSLLMLKLSYWLPVAAPIVLVGMTIGIVALREHRKIKLDNQSLLYLANYDGLTQVANRRRFDEYLQQQWERMTREKSSLSLILCDVDFFKRYNDTYGHQAGDVCLKKVAQAMTQGIKKPTHLVARYGGEEFAVVLPDTNEEGALQIAEAIRSQVQALAIPHEASLVSSQVTLSLGLASIIPSSDLTPALLIKATDEALYQAKKTGRDRCCAFIKLV
ncbi:CHASE2 domain-containing protein [Anabaena sp. UHCC 0451]|uniref:CHASE2 domain-containing protein n=1 Tax=Anabaena sp. UHCC 0451 TaxID=2055235 RepID=UPI002B1EFE0A|nr:diguanylate cyclase [Anabaena sp. UHCC 0451]MEA5577884.1 diguanylate cyclase [Anabaena sp. UHCC 0451]